MGKTLDYDSCAKWMSLSVWAAERYRQWKMDDPGTHWTGAVTEEEEYTAFFHEIAVEALNRGFSLRTGYRSYAVFDLLKAIAPIDVMMHYAFSRTDNESWLTAPGKRKHSNVPE